jgi:hypothetical protein
MHLIASFLNYYFNCGLPLFVLNFLFTWLMAPSFTEAAQVEAVKCGAKKTYAAAHSAVHNMVFALLFWPVGMVSSLLELLKR